MIMQELFSFSQIAMNVVYSVAISLCFLFSSLFLSGALQQSGYQNKKFFRWFFQKENMAKHRFTLGFLLAFFSSAFLALCFCFLPTFVSNVLSLAAIFFFALAFLLSGEKYALKVPLAKTARMKRLLVAEFLVLAIFHYAFISLLNVAAFLLQNVLSDVFKYVPLSLTFLLLPYLLALANGILSPFEKAKNKKYIARASKKMKESGAQIIGITGSYGKTSVKNCLATILSEKFQVIATPSSFNTPIGIAKCVNESSLQGVDFFLAEMGAKNVGDIEELCALYPPTYGIITGVCEQHLQTFQTLENIIAEKSVLKECASLGTATPLSLTEESDKIVFGEKIFEISEVEEGIDGTSFALTWDGETTKLTTRLLAAHSAKNIALAVAIAAAVGLKREEILSGVNKIQEVEHRLQKIQSGGVTILDDAYNANVLGARDAVAVLKKFPKNRFVVTPGIVELGVLEKEKNFLLGKELVGVERVILVGETLVLPVRDGYLSAGGNPECITLVRTLEKAKELLSLELKEGDTVLFLNDLPDVV